MFVKYIFYKTYHIYIIIKLFFLFNIYFLIKNYNFLGQFLGYLTAGINFVLYLPQVLHVYKVKDTNSLDSKFIILQILSCTSTLSYGIVIKEMPIIVSSVSILISTSFLGYAKWILYIDKNITRYNYESIDEKINNINEYSSLKN